MVESNKMSMNPNPEFCHGLTILDNLELETYLTIFNTHSETYTIPDSGSHEEASLS